MTRWLLDTNILSELRRPRPEQRVVAFITAQPLEALYVSVVTFAELRFGIERLADGPRRTELTDWLNRQLRPMFGPRVLPIDEDVMVRWRFLVDEGRRSGHTFSQPDLLIAATALVSGLTLVTRNTADFVAARAPLLDPWSDPLP
ncbi:type II toxin-antitoxin system VapC family toxin [Methylobacterium sp. J-026]|uniref:type II toxin-antitoxin system VapC family toxin n=1 Tax=Methylobacterium sp. J-026 TaxID=2836624 RepID=UPI001FB88DCD|nr:type II toxin-antitoxin system VapC family toxin [Methylobacterium sp. J-026]MCJ2135525.1 type II toxin-antitoxin system VapC family toxin [Methylobacterium sp. J-026]